MKVLIKEYKFYRLEVPDSTLSRNGGQLKFNSRLTLTGCRFGQGRRTHHKLQRCFFTTLPFKKGALQKRVKTENLQTPFWGTAYDFERQLF